MVRFTPAPLARLMTLALQARVHQDGLAPSAVGVSGPAVLPAQVLADRVATPTGYRTSHRAGALDPYDPGERSALRRAASKARRAVRLNRRPKGKAYQLFEFDFRARNLQLPTREAIKEASIKWKKMSEEEKAPWVVKQASGEYAPVFEREPAEAKDALVEDFVDELAKEEAYVFFLFDLRATHPELSRLEASKRAGSQWQSMTDTEKAPFFELAARQKVAPTEAPVDQDKYAAEERYIQKKAKAFFHEVCAQNLNLAREDCSRLAGKKWRAMSDEERAVWDKSLLDKMAVRKLVMAK